MYSRRTIRPASGAGNTPSLPERPTLPPDYAGIAFRPSEERTLQDYPETFIESPAQEGDISIPSLERPPEPIEVPDADIPPMLSVNNEINAGTSVDRVLHSPLEESPPLPDHKNEGETPPHDESFALFDKQEPSVSPSSLPPDHAEDPLDWLEGLKMEDLLLFWMLFRLLYGKNREELEILLCLLLFAR